MPETFEFELDEHVQAVVEGRVAERRDGNRGKEYILETITDTGKRIYRRFAECELDEPEPGGPNTAVVIPMRAA